MQARARARKILEDEASPRAFLKKIGQVPTEDDQFSWDNFMPDAEIDPEALVPWIEYIERNRSQAVGDKWFPGQNGRTIAVANIKQYLHNKLHAMRSRLQGNIQAALEYEGRCDSLYNRLPDYAKW